MPRENSQNWSADDAMTAVRLQDINQDLDDLYAQGNDRGRVVAAASGTPLRIDIASFAWLVGQVRGLYAGGTDITVSDAATNYVEIDDTNTIQINTTGWNNALARLAQVVCSGGVITAITIYKPDVVGGSLGSSGSPSVVTAATQAMVSNAIYIADRSASRIDFTLPATAAVGDKFTIYGKGVGGIRILQNSGQQILCGGYASTSGTAGYLAGEGKFASVTLTCVATDTKFSVDNPTTEVGVDTYLGRGDRDMLGTISVTSNQDQWTGCWTDDQKWWADVDFSAGGSNDILTLYPAKGGVYGNSGVNALFRGGTRQQVTSNTISGQAFYQGKPIIKDGYIHVMSNNTMYRCLITAAIQTAGNWGSMSMSGFPANSEPVGYGNGYWWFKSSGTANDFYYATLSGTTFTYVGTVSVSSGSTTDRFNNMVNELGIYVYTNGGAGVRKSVIASFAGTEDTNRQFEGRVSAGTPYSTYSCDTGDVDKMEIVKIYL